MCVYVCLNFEDNDTKRQARLWNQVSQRELENLWNQVEKKKKKEKKEKKERERDENERAGKLLESSGSKEKEKGEDVLMVYVRGGQNAREKKRKEKGNVWMKERQRIRNHNLKILPQYFHNKF